MGKEWVAKSVIIHRLVCSLELSIDEHCSCEE